MKKLILILFVSLVTTLAARAQEEPIDYASKNPPEGFIKPQYPGEIDTFYKDIQKGIKRRHLPLKSGKVYISFILEKDGNISNIKIIKGLEERLDNRIVKLISQTSGKWTVGYINTLPARTIFYLPITINVKD